METVAGAFGLQLCHTIALAITTSAVSTQGYYFIFHNNYYLVKFDHLLSGGNKTASMMYTIPFEPRAEPNTLAPLTVILPSFLLSVTLSRLTWFKFHTILNHSFGKHTHIHMVFQNSTQLFFVLRLGKVSSVPAGSLSNAALVGAKTVNGPALESAST
jgi:hypothetical protein